MSSPKPLPATSAPDISILGDSVTLHPSGYTESPARQHEEHSRTLIEQMARFRESPFDFLREISLHVTGTGWRAYDDVVGQPVFYPGFSEQMKDKVMENPMLRGKIAQLAGQRVEVEKRDGLLGPGGEGAGKRMREIVASLQEVSEKMVDEMICKMESKRFLRGAYYAATQLLTRAYHQGIHVSSEETLRLRAVAKKAAAEKQSIIFLPSHRSHVDYVSLQIICYRLNLGLPTVVAGDNLNFPLVGPFLQHAGAMWIRRSFGEDQLYSTMVQTYIDTLLQNGYNFECFIEGGRSRTGKLLGPKFGILRFLLDSLLCGRVEDAIVCPVSTQYDKVIEVDSYISELLGQPKPKENLQNFLSASSILNLKLGRVDVRFHEPWSLRGFINEQFERFTSLPAQLSTTESWTEEHKIRLLRTLGFKVLSDINQVSVVMPTALIGTVLLTLRGRGVGKSELIRRVDWLCDRVRNQGGRVAHFAGLPTETVVERGLDVLGPALVGTVADLPEETYYAVDRFQLSFYRNMTIHLFILEALVCAGLYTRVKAGGGAEHHQMTFEELRDQVNFLSQLFRGEFIFPPEGLDANLAKSIRGLEADQVLHVTHADNAPDQPATKFLSIQISDKERESGRENFDFYCFLIWPFIEASWLGAVSLMMLTPPLAHTGDSRLPAKAAQDYAQLLGKTLYHQGDLSYFEAVNKETLKNAYQRFEEDGIVVVTKHRDTASASSSASASAAASGPDTLTLAPEWMPARDPATGRFLPEGKLWEFAEAISHCRREGKNRRDGRTVRTRVLSLAEMVGGILWEQRDGKRKGRRGAAMSVPGVEEIRGRVRRGKTVPVASRL